MANVRELNVSLLDWEARAMLRALTRERDRLLELAETSADENEAADAGNDCLEISGLLERLESEARSTFGDQITSLENRST